MLNRIAISGPIEGGPWFPPSNVHRDGHFRLQCSTDQPLRSILVRVAGDTASSLEGARVGELVVVHGRLQNRTPPGVNVTLPPVEVFASALERLGRPRKKGTGRSLAHSVAVIGTVVREPMALRGCDERGLQFLLENRRHPNGPWGVHPVRRTWLRVAAFGEMARGLDILRRGYSIAVAGQLRPRQLENPDGSTRWLHELVAEHVDFLRFKRVPRAA